LLLKRHVEVGQVDRRTASSFVAEVLTPGRDGNTIIRILSTYRQLWKWLRREGIVEGENPWAEQGPSHHAKGKGKRSINGGSNRRPFTEAEAAKFLASVAGVELDVCRLLSVTGLRMEEACSLLPADVTEAGEITWLRITDAKTEAGKRRVPVVASEVRVMLRQRVEVGKEAVF
jgi:integrase